MNRRIYAVAILLSISILVLAQPSASDRSPGSVDPTFNVGVMWGDLPLGGPEWPRVVGTALASDGRIYVGGHFTNIAGVLRPGLARLLPDGSVDSTFKPETPSVGFYGWDAHIILVQPSGKVLGGWPAWRRFLPDGSVDSSFNPRPPVGEWVGFIAAYPDGRLLGVPNISPTRLLRYDADGELDVEFGREGPQLFGADTPITLQPDGKILAASVTSVFRLDEKGNVDRTFHSPVFATDPPPPCCNHTDVSAIALQRDGKICVGGYFNRVNGTPHEALARFNADGSLDQSFNPPPALTRSIMNSGNMYGPTVALATQINGKLIVAGGFRPADDSFAAGIVRLNADGSWDRTFDAGAGVFWNHLGAPPRIWRVLMQPDGQILVSGTFGGINGVQRANLARLHGDPPLRILPNSIGWSAGGRFEFQLESATIQSVVIEATTDLGAPNWVPIATNTVSTNAQGFTDPDSGILKRRFYRAIAR